MPTSSKICSVCRAKLPRSAFHSDRSRHDGLSRLCRPCRQLRDRNRPRRPLPPEETRKKNLWRKYRLTPDDFDRILRDQGGACAVCAEESTAYHVDHDHACCPSDHTCGRCIRGILCGNCNRMLGLAQDNVRTLSAAIEYLESRV